MLSEFSLSCRKKKTCWEKMILSAAVYVSPKPAYSVLMVPSLMRTYAPPCHHWCWLLKFVLIRNLMVALFFSLEDNIFHWAKVATFFRSYLYVATLFPLLVKANSRALTYVSKPMKLFILKKLKPRASHKCSFNTQSCYLLSYYEMFHQVCSILFFLCRPPHSNFYS